LSLLVGSALLFASGIVRAADEPTLYAPCAACHGGKAEGNAATKAPALAGQDAAYVRRQLQNFRTGLRGMHPSDTLGAQMRATVTTLKDEASIERVAAHVAALPKTVVKPAAGADLRNGNNLYHGKCGACHGGRAEGNPALNAPRLAGLDATYLKRQFAHFRDGVRGTHKDDRPGRQMSLMAKTLPGARDLDDVIAFIHLQGQAK
jgi:cytochrome c553